MAGGTQLGAGPPRDSASAAQRGRPDRAMFERWQAQRRARQFRRVIVFAVMSLVVPGSAHLLAGRARLGTALLRGYLVLIGLVGLAVLVGVVDHGFVLALAVKPTPLLFVQYAAMAVGLAWAAVVVSGAALGQPHRLRLGHRRAVAMIVAMLCLAVVAPMFTASRYAAAQRELITDLFPDTAANGLDDRINILLLGGDGTPGRSGVRTDSITLASVDRRTGQTVLFSLPRNLQKVPFPDTSPLHARFPAGFDCDGCLLNAVYTYAVTHRQQLYPGVDDPGPRAVKEAVSGALGIPVHYYVLVNLDGFRGIIDALGGVTINVERALPIGDHGRKLPAGLQHLNGYQAMWYARSRSDSSDYARMARQRCVMSALLHQADPMTVLLRYQELAESTKDLMATDIPRDLLPELVDLALEARSAKITNIQFVPPFVVTRAPDFALIRNTVAAALDPARSTAQPSPTAASSKSGSAGQTGSGSATGSDSGTRPKPASTPSATPGAAVALSDTCSDT